MQEIGEGDKAPPEWLGEIEPTFLSYEAVPVLKFPFFNEVSFHLFGTCTASAINIIVLHALSCSEPTHCYADGAHCISCNSHVNCTQDDTHEMTI